MSLVPVNADNFEQEVLNSDVPVLVDFYANWCGPCKLTMGHIAAMLNERSDGLKVVKIDVDESGELAQKYAVKGIPTLILFQKGEPAETRLSGFQDKGKLQRYVDGLLQG